MLYKAFIDARIVTHFNYIDPEPKWTEYELASRDEFAMVIFVSGKEGMAEMLGQWSDAGWKAELDREPGLKQFINDNYHVNPVAATGDDYGFTTTTLKEETEAFRKEWERRIPNTPWDEKELCHLLQMTSRGESALNLTEGFCGVFDLRVHKVANIYGHPSQMDIPITLSSELQRKGRAGRNRNAVAFQFYANEYERNLHEIIPGEPVYDALQMVRSNGFARSTCCLNERNFTATRFFVDLLGLGKPKSGRSPMLPDCRGYLLLPDFQEMGEWVKPPTEEEIVDALVEQKWALETFAVKCLDLEDSKVEGRLNFLNRYANVSREICSPVENATNPISWQERERRRKNNLCWNCGATDHQANSKHGFSQKSFSLA